MKKNNILITVLISFFPSLMLFSVGVTGILIMINFLSTVQSNPATMFPLIITTLIFFIIGIVLPVVFPLITYKIVKK